MRLFTVFPLLGAYASALLAKDFDEPIAEPVIRHFGYSGNGCPQGTVNHTLSPVNSTAGNYSLAAYLPAAITPGVNSTRLCAFQVGVGLPPGYQFTINNRGVDVSGNIWLPDARRKFSAIFNFHWSNDEGSPPVSCALSGRTIGEEEHEADVV